MENEKKTYKVWNPKRNVKEFDNLTSALIEASMAWEETGMETLIEVGEYPNAKKVCRFYGPAREPRRSARGLSKIKMKED